MTERVHRFGYPRVWVLQQRHVICEIGMVVDTPKTFERGAPDPHLPQTEIEAKGTEPVIGQRERPAPADDNGLSGADLSFAVWSAV